MCESHGPVQWAQVPTPAPREAALRAGVEHAEKAGVGGEGGRLTQENRGGGGASWGLSEAPAPHQPRPPRYSVEGFIDKNRDHLFQDFKRLMYNRCVGARGWKGLRTLGSDTCLVG